MLSLGTWGPHKIESHIRWAYRFLAFLSTIPYPRTQVDFQLLEGRSESRTYFFLKNCVMFFKFDLPCALAREDLIYSQIGSTIMGRWRRALLDKDK